MKNRSNMTAWYVGFVTLYAVLVAFDAFTTYLVTPDLKWEGNPTVTLFGGGWGALIVCGIIFVILTAVFAYFPMIYYKREKVECEGFADFYSKTFGKRRKGKKFNSLVPVGVIIIFAGIFSRLYVITIAFFQLHDYRPCLFCALGISHSVCNNVVIKLGDRRLLLPVVMFAIVGILSIASFLIWIIREYKINKKL